MITLDLDKNCLVVDYLLADAVFKQSEMKQYKIPAPKEFKNTRMPNDKAIRVLRKHGVIVTSDEATFILDFLYPLAKKTRQHEIREECATDPLGDIEPK
ncbi:MAG TPA: hypothetical protein VGO58_10750 [Chitinophagaceae bacterium]|nr:hypothetical protein [Chitinophagaceae bacterium]